MQGQAQLGSRELLNGRKRHHNSSVTNCAQPWTLAAGTPPSHLNIRHIWAHSALLGPWWVRRQNYCLQLKKGHRSISINQHLFVCYQWAKRPLSWFLSYFFLNPFQPPHQQNWIRGGVFCLADNSSSTPLVNLCFKVNKGYREMRSSIGVFISNQ